MCLLTPFQLLYSFNYSVLFIHDGISRCDTSNFNCSSLSNSKFTLECKGERIDAILVVFWYKNVCPKSPKFPTPGSGENFEKVTSHFCVAPMTSHRIPSDWSNWWKSPWLIAPWSGRTLTLGKRTSFPEKRCQTTIFTSSPVIWVWINTY